MTDRLPGPPADRGMQQERTLLAWERTGLSLVVAALAVGRHAIEEPGALIAVPCLLVAACGVWIYLTSLRQGRQARTSLREPPFCAVLHDGRLPAVVAALMTTLCLCEAASALGAFGTG